jgi:DNA-binding CsgD family transcriptional regulator/tetratricopeptide (TPR) repeat protein
MIDRRPLVERGEQLLSLQGVISGSAEEGHVVLISGEAGHGKTSLLSVFLDTLDHRFTILSAACEPVGIPAPFAPLYDLLDKLPTDLVTEIRSGAGRPIIYAGLLDVLKNDRVMLVVEDVHWADEATLGLVRYLGRRIASTGGTLIITYRTEAVDLAPLLRLVIADLGPAAVRIDLPALSLEGVSAMCRGLDLDPAQVHAATLGNPFFVEEVIRHPELRVPPSVQNAVLVNAEQLSEDARELLYMVALSPDGIDLDLLISSGPDAGAYVDTALRRLLLATSGDRIACRHDLIRESLLQAIPPLLARSLHRRLLEHLEGRAGDSVDTARLAYHAVGAGDAAKAVVYSLRAAEDARALGAHRQTAFHYSNALSFAETLDSATLDQVLLDAAMEHCVINAFETAVDLASQRVVLAADPVSLARARAWVSYFLSRLNELDGCGREALFAIEILRTEPMTEELAVGLAVFAWRELVEGRYSEAIRYGDQAVTVARAVHYPPMEVHAAVTAGTARSFLHDPAGRSQVEAAVRLGVERNLGEFAARAMNNLGLLSLWRGRPVQALQEFERLVEYTQTRELDAWYIAAIATRATLNVMHGRWDEADLDLEMVMGQETCRQTEIETLNTAAILRARRGDPGAADLIEDAVTSVESFDDHEANVTACALAMEGAWIGLISREAAEFRYREILRSPVLPADDSGRGVLGYWATRLGLEAPEGRIPGPAGLERDGRVAEASQSWEERGYPVEAAVTKAMLPDANLEAVFSGLSKLGADGVIRGLRTELQRRRVARIPRGQRQTTRQNPFGLTERQAEVLSLMVSGLSNAAIAEQLFITEKTVSHHVSAVLTKLNVSSRLQAVALVNSDDWPDQRGLN